MLAIDYPDYWVEFTLERGGSETTPGRETNGGGGGRKTHPKQKIIAMSSTEAFNDADALVTRSS